MAKVRYGSGGVSYRWTPQVPLPFGRGLKPCSQPARPDVMFPDPKDEEGIENAKFICGLCDVQSQCLAEALKYPKGKDFGVWGGLTQNERHALRRKMQREARKASVSEPSVWPRPVWTPCPHWAGPTLHRVPPV